MTQHNSNYEKLNLLRIISFPLMFVRHFDYGGSAAVGDENLRRWI